MTPADLTARILKASRDAIMRGLPEDEPDTITEWAYETIGKAAAREALIAVREEIDGSRIVNRRPIGSLAGGGWNAAIAHVSSRINELLTALQGGDDGTEGTGDVAAKVRCDNIAPVAVRDGGSVGGHTGATDQDRGTDRVTPEDK